MNTFYIVKTDYEEDPEIHYFRTEEHALNFCKEWIEKWAETKEGKRHYDSAQEALEDFEIDWDIEWIIKCRVDIFDD